MGERGSIRVLVEQRDALAAQRRAERRAQYEACREYFQRRYSCTPLGGGS